MDKTNSSFMFFNFLKVMTSFTILTTIYFFQRRIIKFNQIFSENYIVSVIFCLDLIFISIVSIKVFKRQTFFYITVNLLTGIFLILGVISSLISKFFNVFSVVSKLKNVLVFEISSFLGFIFCFAHNFLFSFI